MLSVVMVVVHASPAAPTVDSLLVLALAASVTRGKDRALRWPVFTDGSHLLVEAYGRAKRSPLWSRASQPTASARRFLLALQSVSSRGLDARDYDVARLSALVDSGLVTQSQQVAFDLTMSVAAVRVLHSHRFGRIDPSDAHAHLRLPRDSFELKVAFGAPVTSVTPDDLLDAAEPPCVHYLLLKRALAAYRARAISDTTVLPGVRKIELTTGQLSDMDN